MSFNWSTKKILIVGASSGMGEATARYLSSLGAWTFLVGRNEKKLQLLKEELGEQTSYIPIDLSETERIVEIFDAALERGYVFDGVFFSAGVDESLPIRVNSIGKEEKMLRINTLSFLELIKFATKKKYSADYLSIVGISSIVTKVLNAGSANYAMSKSALTAVAKVAAREYISRGVRVNTISPALTDTPLISDRKNSGGAFADNGIHLQKLGYIEPIQIAYLAEFLLSDKSKYITGADIEVSAGWGF